MEKLEVKKWVNEIVHRTGSETLSSGGYAFDKVKEKYSGSLI